MRASRWTYSCTRTTSIELRSKHRVTHVFRVERDEIFAAPILVGAPRLSDTNRTISFRENPDFACYLWREALLRQMVTRGRLAGGVVVSRAAKMRLAAAKPTAKRKKS